MFNNFICTQQFASLSYVHNFFFLMISIYVCTYAAIISIMRIRRCARRQFHCDVIVELVLVTEELHFRHLQPSWTSWKRMKAPSSRLQVAKWVAPPKEFSWCGSLRLDCLISSHAESKPFPWGKLLEFTRWLDSQRTETHKMAWTEGRLGQKGKTVLHTN